MEKMDIEGKLPETNAAHVTAIEGKNGTADTAELSAHKLKDTRKLKIVFEDDGYNKMNEAIGRMLKRLRKEHNMSVKDVKQRLHDDYGVDVAEKTLYNWESGNSIPGISFYFMNWHISWIIWPVAAVVFAAIHSIMAAVTVK